MKLLNYIGLVLILFCVSCSTSIKTQNFGSALSPLPDDAEIVVMAETDAAPANAIKLGKVRIGDSGFTTKCDYNTVIEQAKQEARKTGGNALKITKLKEPTVLGSTCYRIEADILKIRDTQTYLEKIKREQDSITRSKFPENPDYALLYIYRPKSGVGALLNYTVHLNGVPVAKIYNGTKEVVEIRKEGMQVIRASLETETIIGADIKFGEEYFLECGINTGVFIGRPRLNLVDKKIGREQFEKIQD